MSLIRGSFDKIIYEKLGRGEHVIKTTKGINIFAGIILPIRERARPEENCNITEQQFLFVLERCFEEFLESLKSL